jgi:hypothetical protein
MHNVLWVPCPQFKRLFSKEFIFPTCNGDDGQFNKYFSFVKRILTFYLHRVNVENKSMYI